MGRDYTAMNGLKVRCREKASTSTEWITVHTGDWGEWEDQVTDSERYVKEGQVRYEDPLRWGDDTALNGLSFRYKVAETPSPTKNPTKDPTAAPTKDPTASPIKATSAPTKDPTASSIKATNLSKGKDATQSSTCSKGYAARAVDGNNDGIWGHSSVSSTCKKALNTWQVS